MHCSRLPARWAGLLAALSLTAGCSRPSDSLPEWKASDHDNQAKPAQGQVDTKAPRPGMPDLAKEGITDLTLATWKQNCVKCHGLIGRGDGPQAATFRPPDFTNPEWQRVALDTEMERAISKGRGRMPAFGHLPPDTVMSLVRLVRRMGPQADSPKDAAPAAAEGARPSLPPAHPPLPGRPAPGP